MNLFDALRAQHLGESEVWALIPQMQARLQTLNRPVPTDPFELYLATTATLPERLEAECEQMRAENERLRAEIAAIPAKSAELDAEIERLRGEIAAENAKAAAISAQIEQEKARIRELNRKNDPAFLAAKMVVKYGIHDPRNPKETITHGPKEN
ncbi:MAG: hypothetical protein J0M24_10825 [Verrucomicrobia bacterium]|nr:hypothetical protein [Verrucomicrobiota bacterium]